MPRQPQRMIPRRGGNHPQARLLRRKLRQCIARPALLETARALEVLLLAKNRRPRQFAERGRLHARRAHNRAVQTRARRHDFGQAHRRCWLGIHVGLILKNKKP